MSLFDEIGLTGDNCFRASSIDEQSAYGRGQLYWVPISYRASSLHYLYPRSCDPYGKRPPEFTLESVSGTEVRADPSVSEKGSIFDHVPLLYPDFGVKLQKDEVYVAQVSKKRKVIVVSPPIKERSLRSGQTGQSCHLVAPIFTFHEGDPEIFRQEIRDFKYTELFYVPESAQHNVRESCVRFDCLQVVPTELLARTHVALSPDYMELLDEWLYKFVTGSFLKQRAEGFIEAYFGERSSQNIH